MAQNGALSANQLRFVGAMLTASSVREAARLSGLGERTGWRYLQDPAVKRALSEVVDGTLACVVQQTVGAMGAAVDTLQEVSKNKLAPAGARVSAARAILDGGPRLREAVTLSERVEELERAIMGQEVAT